MIIYKTTNLINGKIYIGRDTKNNSKYLGSGKILKNAILKYGKNNFKKEILEFGTSNFDLNEKEIKWIEFYNSTNPEIGYNITKGGTGGRTYNKKIYQYSLDGNFIKKWNSISECSFTLKLDNSCLSKAAKGELIKHGDFMWRYVKHNKINPYHDNKSTPILQKTINNIKIKKWNSINEIEKKLKYDVSNIIASIKRNGTAYGYRWEKIN